MTVLDILGSLYLHINFRIIFWISSQKPAEILIRIEIISKSIWESIATLTICFPIHEHGMSFHLFRCPLIQGSPTSGPWTTIGPWPVRNWAEQQKVSGGQMSEASSVAPHHSPSLALPPEPSLALLPEPSPTPSVEKLSSTKPVPGAKKFGDHCFNCFLSTKDIL